MKRLLMLVMIIGLFVLTGCTKVGNYKEGTYFAYDKTSGYTAVVYVDNNGVIKSVFFDAPYIKYDTNNKCPEINNRGKIQCVPTTKQSLGDDYGMKNASPIKKEWYEQAASFADKVVAEQGIDWLTLKYQDESGKLTITKPTGSTETEPTYTDSVTGVTMSIDGFSKTITDIINQAKK